MIFLLTEIHLYSLEIIPCLHYIWVAITSSYKWNWEYFLSCNTFSVQVIVFWILNQSICICGNKMLTSTSGSHLLISNKSIQAFSNLWTLCPQCVSDSTKINTEILRRVEKVSEMKEWVKPKLAPVLFNHHNYTRIFVDASPGNQHTVMFLSLSEYKFPKLVMKWAEVFKQP